MKYILECHFKGRPECERCMLSEDDGVHRNCMALGIRPRCPEEGCRKDCPLKFPDDRCQNAERLPDGKCRGYQKARWDDEPSEKCIQCNIFELYEVE